MNRRGLPAGRLCHSEATYGLGNAFWPFFAAIRLAGREIFTGKDGFP